MADSGKNKREKNEFKDTRNRWWIWTAVAIVVVIILLLVFNRKSTVVADDATPTTSGMLILEQEKQVKLEDWNHCCPVKESGPLPLLEYRT